MLLLMATYTISWAISIPLCQNIGGGCHKALHPDKTEEMALYQEAACAARCRLANETMTFIGCYYSCNNSKESDIKKINESLDLQLVCRNQSAIVLKVIPGPIADVSPEVNVYVIKIYNVSAPENVSVFLSDSAFFVIGNLMPDTNYSISVVAVNADNKYSVITNNIQYETLNRWQVPKNISDIHFMKFEPNLEYHMLLNALISWKPTSDMTCHYKIWFYPQENANVEIASMEIRDPTKLYEVELESLMFESTYQVGVTAVNGQKESHADWTTITTPYCLDWYPNNLTICAPMQPTILDVDATPLSLDEVQLNITWDKPSAVPDYYTVRILDLDQFHPTNSNSVQLNVSKDESHVLIPSLRLHGMMYEIHLTAYSLGGNSTAIESMTRKPIITPEEQPIFKVRTAILAPTICIGIMALVLVIIFHRRAKFKRYQERCKYFEELEKKAPIDPQSNFTFPEKNKLLLATIEHTKQSASYGILEKLAIDDEMEIDRDNLKLFEILGEGAFGLVRRGMLNSMENSTQEVAVKMLKDHPCSDDIRAFRREIEVMKSVGNHPNIVGIIGHYTREFNDMMLLTEYCSLGNLLDFLRTEWNYLLEMKSNLNQTLSTSTPTLAANKKQDENAFNFNTSLIEKTSLKYKNISNEELKRIPTFAAYNKAYGYEDLCTNACRCHVQVLSNDDNSQPHQVQIDNCDCKMRIRAVANKGYYRSVSAKDVSVELSSEAQRHPLSSADLLHIALQIASGMEFLSKNKVVHRDLAARNVLVCQNRTVKIADFGLSRDIYQENVYKKTGNGKLPIKWLALESMTHQVYTTRSDVWAFGILLYEIVTLGGTPYPSIPTSRLLHLLKTGYRMDRPKNCGQSFYDLMASCWHTNPSERPQFSAIYETLNSLLTNSPDEQIINLVIPVKKAKKQVSYEAYLKPI